MTFSCIHTYVFYVLSFIMSCFMSYCLHVHSYLGISYIYVYICIQRDRERERERGRNMYIYRSRCRYGCILDIDIIYI